MIESCDGPSRPGCGPLRAAPSPYPEYNESTTAIPSTTCAIGGNPNPFSESSFGLSRRLMYSCTDRVPGPPRAYEIVPRELVWRTGSSAMQRIFHALSIFGSPDSPNCATKSFTTRKKRALS